MIISLLILLLVLMSCSLLCLGYFLNRDEQVFQLRTRLLGKIQSCSQKDISLGRDWNWRYDVYGSVSYDKMLYSFKKLKTENYYTDLHFIQDPE